MMQLLIYLLIPNYILWIKILKYIIDESKSNLTLKNDGIDSNGVLNDDNIIWIIQIIIGI